MATWFRSALQTTPGDLLVHHQRQCATLKKRQSEVAAMHARLLNTYLAGTIDEPTFKAKLAELKSESLRIDEALHKAGAADAE